VIPAPFPRFKSTADLLMEQIRELEQRIQDMRSDPIQLLAAVYDLKNLALIVLEKAVVDVACGRVPTDVAVEVVKSFVVEDPRYIDVATSALAAARALLIRAHGRKKKDNDECRCRDGTLLKNWAVEAVSTGAPTKSCP